jgi:Uma2 family endonuclease
VLVPEPVEEGTASMTAFPLRQEIVEYPTSDGQPMAETDLHRDVIIDLILGLRRRYDDQRAVWVSGNVFLCYEEGNPKAAIAPDVLLVKGVEKRQRDNYLLWEEGRPPNLVVEVSSRSTSRQDVRDKRAVYERIGVEEYILFDPYDEYLKPRLQGFRLQGGTYQPIPPRVDGTLQSRSTGVTFMPEGGRLRMRDTETGELVLWPEEETKERQREAAARVAAEKRAAKEARARAAADKRAAKEARARAAAEQRADEEAAARSAAEKRAAAAEDRARLLEEQLAKLLPTSKPKRKS